MVASCRPGLAMCVICTCIPLELFYKFLADDESGVAMFVEGPSAIGATGGF